MFRSPKTSSLRGIMVTRTPAVPRKVLVRSVQDHGGLSFHGTDITQTQSLFVYRLFNSINYIIVC